jgi:hypothetical protein
MGDDSRIALILSSPHLNMFHLWDCLIPDAVKNSGVPVSIMLWSNSQDRVSAFLQHAQPGYATHAYGFNEYVIATCFFLRPLNLSLFLRVNEPSQAYMSVEDGVSAWNSYIRPLASQGYTLGSPCTTSAPDGFDWVTNFFSQCGGDCGVNEVTVHWYDVKFEDFQTYVEKWAGFGKPLRITEFACQVRVFHLVFLS